jgi:hypothetical protein
VLPPQKLGRGILPYDFVERGEKVNRYCEGADCWPEPDGTPCWLGVLVPAPEGARCGICRLEPGFTGSSRGITGCS